MFVFSLKWCKWIHLCFLGANFLVLINGAPVGFFSSTQGVRQGDPLFPLLFIIMEEALSRKITKFHDQGLW